MSLEARVEEMELIYIPASDFHFRPSKLDRHSQKLSAPSYEAR